MSYYTSSISTQIIDPQFNSSKYRTEFRIVKDGLYSTAMRILNIGLTANAQSIASGGRYNLLTGAGSAIKSIYLYDGRQVLDSVVNYADKSAFTAYNHGNNENRDIYKALSKNGLGFVFDQKPDEEGTPQPLFQNLIKEDFPNMSHTPKLTQEESALGFLNLREVFPLLRQLPFISTKLFPNLRVVIEYNLTDALVEQGMAGVATGTSQPILVVDQVMNDELEASTVANFTNVVWTACEVESVSVPKPTDPIAGTQSIKYRLNGFANKTLMSLLIQKKGSTDVSNLYKSHGSITGLREAIQVMVNGSNLFPLEGINRANERLAILHDTFGVCNSHPANANLAIYGSANFIDDFVNRVGNTDYIGCTINKPITSLEVQFSRQYDITEGTTLDPRYSQALTLNIFGNVLKSIVKNPKGGYSVLYV